MVHLICLLQYFNCILIVGIHKIETCQNYQRKWFMMQLLSDSIIQVVGIFVDRKIYMSAIKNVYQYINCKGKQKLLQYF